MSPRKCEAFTKSFHPCRGYADHATGLCAKHTTWFSEFKWAPIVARKVRWNALTQALRWAKQLFSNPRTTFAWDTMGKNLNSIWIAEDASWPERRTADLLYELLCETGRIEPPSCVGLWNNKVERYCGVLSDMITTGVHPRTVQQTAKYTFLNHYMSHAPSTLLLGSYMALMPKLAQSIPHTSLLTITDMVLEHVDGIRLAFFDRQKLVGLIKSGQAITARFFPPTPGVSAFLGELNRYFEVRLKERALAVRTEMKARCDTFKEELMMNRWHPDRVMKFVEAGIDVEDM